MENIKNTTKDKNNLNRNINMKGNKIAELRKFLNEEDIQRILRSMSIKTKLKLTSNPEKFENLTREYEDSLTHSWAGSSTTKKETEVLRGDFVPGLDYKYQYSDNGNLSLPEIQNKMSEFTLNKIQIAKTIESRESTFKGDNFDEEPVDSIVVYIPNEKEFGDFTSFKEMTIAKREEKQFNKIKECVGTALTDEEIKEIVSNYNFEYLSDLDVSVVTDPQEFDSKVRPYSCEYKHSWAGRDINERNTVSFLGDYNPGMYSLYQYIDNGNEEPEEIEEKMSDFNLHNVQVVSTDTIIDETLSEPHNYSQKTELVVYIPNEKELPAYTMFSELVNAEKNVVKLAEEIKEISSSELTNAVIKDIIEMAEKEKISEKDEQER